MLEKKSKIWQLINKLLFFVFLVLSLNSLAENKKDSFLDLSLEELMNVSVASLFDESLLEASSSVTVISEDTWQNNGARRTNEIMSYQASTMVHPTLGGADAFAIRGFSNRLSVRGIATLLDGVPLNTYSFGTAQYFLANFDLGALQRAELIRGPGSAIYGSDAFHGVLSLSTFMPDKNTVETELGLGSPGYARAHIRFSQSVGESSRLSGAVASTHQGDGHIIFDTADPNIQGVREDAYLSKTAYIKSKNTLNQHWDTQWGLYYNRWKGSDFPSFGEIILGENDVSNNQQEFYMLTANARYSWNQNQSLQIKSYFWNTDQQFEYELQALPFQAQEDQRYGLSIIMKDEGADNGPRWLLGIGADKTEVVSTGVSTGVQAFDGLKRNIGNVFAQVRWPFLEGKLLFDLGARVDEYSDFDSHFSPRMGLVYLLEDNQAVKFQYGHAFRAPVAGEVSSSGNIQGNLDLLPETIDTYELIWMKQKELYSLTTTLFMSNWQDAIIIVDDNSLPAPFIRRYDNLGDFSSKGLELESSILIDDWKIEGAYSFVKSEDKNKSEAFVAFPEHIFQLGVSNYINSKLDIHLFNRAYFDVSANPGQASGQLGDIWQLNLGMNYQWDKNLLISVDIRNALNREDPVPSLWGNDQGLPVDGIQFSSYLRYQF